MKHSHLKNKSSKIQSLFVLVIFPISQIGSFLLLIHEFSTLYLIPSTYLYTIVAVLLILFILISYVLFVRHKKKKAARSIQELSNIRQYQKKYYDAIQHTKNESEKARNSFHNELEKISMLLVEQKYEDTLLLINDLTNHIKQLHLYPFCSNPVINAVICNKESACHEYQIPIQVNLQIGDCTSVENLHLCSIFSNLLDNAIEACKTISLPTERFILLTAIQQGDYLHIKVKNSAKNLVAPKAGHGYGQKILTDIAKKYSGEFKTQFKNQTYEAYLTIQRP